MIYVKGLSDDDDGDNNDENMFSECVQLSGHSVYCTYLVTSISHNSATIEDEELRKLQWFAQDHEAISGKIFILSVITYINLSGLHPFSRRVLLPVV